MELIEHFVNIAIKANKKAVALTGECHNVTNRPNLESALSSTFYANSKKEAAALAVKGVMRAHAFEQGNKRTAFIMCGYFLGRVPRLTVEQMRAKIKKWEIKLIMRKL